MPESFKKTVKTLFYYFTKDKIINGGNWGITTSEVKAKRLDKDYKLATLEDLNDLICANGRIFSGVIEVKEGLYEWRERLVYVGEGMYEVIGDYERVAT